MYESKLQSCGFFDTDKALPNVKRTDYRITSHYELELYVECDGRAIIDDKEYPLSPDTVLLCAPGARRKSVLGFKCHYLHFDLDTRGKYSGLLKTAPVIYGIIDTAAYRDAMVSIIRHVALDEKNISSDYTQARLLELLYMLAADADKNRNFENLRKNKKASAEFVPEIIEFMRRHYAEKLSLEILSEKFFYSPNFIRTVFKNVTGISPREYLDELRLGAARIMLSEKDCDIGQVALSCGFASQSYFTAQFKKNYGCTPKSFRASRQLRQNEDFCGKGDSFIPLIK